MRERERRVRINWTPGHLRGLWEGGVVPVGVVNGEHFVCGSFGTLCLLLSVHVCHFPACSLSCAVRGIILGREYFFFLVRACKLYE